MSESTDPQASEPAPATNQVAAADQLPPVAPPSAGFIVQLFLIPMLIVGIIVVVWLMFSWLAQMGNRPEELVNDLERINHASWQQALTLGKALQDPSNAEFARNPKLAKRLSEVLKKHIDDGHLDRDHVFLRMYLCLALGEFESLEGVPVLVQAAETERDPSELDVRRAAVWALGRLAKRNTSEELLKYDGVMAAIDRAASDTGGVDDEKARGRVRSTAAYILGEFAGADACEKLAQLTFDAHPDVRYNAAVSLARHGDVRATETLLEMLSLENAESSRLEKAEDQEWKRQDVMFQGLRAVNFLAEKNPSADLIEITKAIEQMSVADNIGEGLKVHAAETLTIISGSAEVETAAP